eukprot:gene1428-12047_t
MSILFKPKEKPYKDKKFPGTMEDFKKGLDNSLMVYIGKLSSNTTEEQIYAYFSKIGLIKRIIMGINRIDKTPCGFGFVEYFERQNVLDAVKYFNGAKIDNRIIHVAIDFGFYEGRQYGRGKGGGAKREEVQKEVTSENPNKRKFEQEESPNKKIRIEEKE